MANLRNTKVQYPSPDQDPLSSGPRRDIRELILSQSALEACFDLNLSSPAIPHIFLFHFFELLVEVPIGVPERTCRKKSICFSVNLGCFINSFFSHETVEPWKHTLFLRLWVFKGE